MDKKSKRLFFFCVVSVFFFSFLAYSYRFLSLSFSADSTLIVQDGADCFYQISLGRFLQPIYWIIRGKIVAPLLVGLFSSAFLSISSYIISKSFQFDSLLTIFLFNGILVTNETFSLSAATYIPWTDVYALSALMASLGFYFSIKKEKRNILSVLFFTLSLGLYPCYIFFAATLLVIYYIRCILFDNSDSLTLWRRGIQSIIHLLCGLILYAFLLRIVLLIFSITASNDYNGVGRLSEITLPSLISLFPYAYSMPLSFLFNPFQRNIIPSHSALIPAGINIVLLITSMMSLSYYVFKNKTSLSNIFTLCFLLSILPLSMNGIYLISGGLMNGLLIPSYFLFYILPLIFIDSSYNRFSKKQHLVSYAKILLLFIIILINTTTSNRLALKRDLEYSSTLSAITRIIDDTESVDHYVPGKTPVYINGYLPSSSISMVKDGFEDLTDLQGVRYTYSASYEDSTIWYLKYLLNEPFVPADDTQIQFVQKKEEFKNMPRYPVPGYISMIDNILVIKL